LKSCKGLTVSQMLSLSSRLTVVPRSSLVRNFHVTTFVQTGRTHVPRQGYPKDVQLKRNHGIPEPIEGTRESIGPDAPEKPRRVILDEFIPSKSHMEKARYKRPYKIDRRGRPVWAEMPAYNPSRYPGIEIQPLIIPRKERHPWDPQV
jgi:hypothetical protein